MDGDRHDVGSRALDESPADDYIGRRDLTRWPTRAGAAAARSALRATRWLAPHWLLVVGLVGGLCLVAALTAMSAAVYDAVVEADGIAGLDRPALRLAIAVRSAPLTTIIGAYTMLGGTIGMPILATTIALTMAIAWRRLAPVVLVAATGAGTLALTVVGKAVVSRTRPPLSDAVPPFEYSHSFPSGHTLNGVALAGIVAYLLVRRQRSLGSRVLTVAVAGVFAGTMGLSRVYLGVHWLTDVLVAWTLGLAWLTVVITTHRLFLTVRRHRTVAGPPDGAAPPRPAPPSVTGQ